MAKIVAFLSSKGGVGKSTTAVNTACALIQANYNTLLVDIDPQGSAQNWANARVDSVVPVIGMRENIKKDLPGIAQSYDFVIIDGTSKSELIEAAAMTISDIVIIPVAPSPFDIWGCQDLVDVIKQRQMITDGQPHATFMVSRGKTNSKLLRQLKPALLELDMPVMKYGTTDLNDYKEVVKTGESVVELGNDNKARIEIKRITNEIISMLENMNEQA